MGPLFFFSHAVVAAVQHWRLAPAYDLAPNPEHGSQEPQLALACGHFGRAARRDNLLSGAPRFGLTREQAASLIDEISGVVSTHWRAEVLRWGGAERDCEAIAPAFCYEGFEYPMDEIYAVIKTAEGLWAAFEVKLRHDRPGLPTSAAWVAYPSHVCSVLRK